MPLDKYEAIWIVIVLGAVALACGYLWNDCLSVALEVWAAWR